jgi:hypothetical protein
MSEAVMIEGLQQPFTYDIEQFTLQYRRYNGDKPYEIKDDGGNVVLVVSPGDLIILPHLSGDSTEYQLLRPLAKARRFISAFKQIVSTYAQDREIDSYDAVFLGMTHLGRYFNKLQRNLTESGSTTQILWDTKSLPPALLDYAAESNASLVTEYGGDREVQKEDIIYFCFRPTTVLDYLP